MSITSTSPIGQGGSQPVSSVLDRSEEIPLADVFTTIEKVESLFEANRFNAEDLLNNLASTCIQKQYLPGLLAIMNLFSQEELSTSISDNDRKEVERILNQVVTIDDDADVLSRMVNLLHEKNPQFSYGEYFIPYCNSWLKRRATNLGLDAELLRVCTILREHGVELERCKEILKVLIDKSNPLVIRGAHLELAELLLSGQNAADVLCAKELLQTVANMSLEASEKWQYGYMAVHDVCAKYEIFPEMRKKLLFKCIEHDPRDSKAHLFLARLYLAEGGKVKEATDLLEKAAQEELSVPLSVELMGEIHDTLSEYNLLPLTRKKLLEYRVGRDLYGGIASFLLARFILLNEGESEGVIEKAKGLLKETCTGSASYTQHKEVWGYLEKDTLEDLCRALDLLELNIDKEYKNGSSVQLCKRRVSSFQ